MYQKTRYDAHVIQSHADELYDRAEGIVWQSVMKGLFFAAAIGFLIGHFVFEAGGLWLIVGAGIGGYLGYLSGERKAFELRLQAQAALCQMMIEKNTRSNDVPTP